MRKTLTAISLFTLLSCSDSYDSKLSSSCGAEPILLSEIDNEIIDSEIIEKANGSVASLYDYFRGNYCSGVLIEEDTFLTAGHCIALLKLYPNLAIFEKNNKKVAYKVKSVIDQGLYQGLDYALLEVEKTSIWSRQHLPEALSLLDESFAASDGEAVFTIHHPEGKEKHISIGNVLRLEDKHFYHNLETRPGSSGAPILSKQGEVVGLHYRGGCAEGGNKAVASSAIRQVISSLSQGTDLDTDGTEHTFDDFPNHPDQAIPYHHSVNGKIDFPMDIDWLSITPTSSSLIIHLDSAQQTPLLVSLIDPENPFHPALITEFPAKVELSTNKTYFVGIRGENRQVLGDYVLNIVEYN